MAAQTDRDEAGAAGERTPREERKCAQILAGAREAFMAEGFGGASVDAIAMRAGISKATLYRYYPDKTAIFAAVVRHECICQAEKMLAMAKARGSIAEQVHRFTRAYVAFLFSPLAQEVFRVVVAESARLPEIGAIFLESGPENGCRRLAPLFEAATARGELAVDDAVYAAYQLLDLCKGELFYRCLLGVATEIPPKALEAHARRAAETFLRAYRPG